MNDSVRDLGIRLGRALGFDVDPEWFGSDAGWAIVAKLESFMNEHRKLDPGVLRLVEEVAIAMNARGKDEAVFHATLEAQLGLSPFPPETIIAIVRYVRAQLHFAEKPRRVELDPGMASHTPLKTLDFGESVLPEPGPKRRS